MTSQDTFPLKFTKIDNLTREHHVHLTKTDECFFLGEYTAYKGYQYSETNNLIFNFKKSVEYKGTSQWQYKINAVQVVATAFREGLNSELLNLLTFIPIPPSKNKSHKLYDDRLMQMLQKINPDGNLDIRELLVQKTSIQAFHKR